MKNKMRYEKNRISLAALGFAAALSMLTGCGKMELTSDTVTTELGNPLSEDPRAYVTLEKDEQYGQVQIDISNVNTDVAGSYTAVVSYKDTSYELKVDVVDTTAPEIETVDFFEVKAGTELKAEDILTNVSDLSEVNCMISGVTKIGEPEEYSQELAASPITLDDAELEEVSGLFTEEGIYEVTAYAVDAAGNRSGANAIVVVDGTAPELNVNSTELEVDASEFTTEATDMNEVLNALHELPWTVDAEAMDNYKMPEDGVNYVITSSEADVTGTDLVEHMTLTYTLCDAVGNTAEQNVELQITYAGLDAQKIGKQTGLIGEKAAPKKEQTATTKNSTAGNAGSSSSQSNVAASNNTTEESSSSGGLTLVGYYIGDVWHDASEIQYYTGSMEDCAKEVFGYINQARADAGLNQLEWDSGMAELASIRAAEINEFYSHERPDGTRVSQTYGYGENIFDGGWSPSDVHEVFMSSQGHRENILREGITKGAVGCYQTEYGFLCTVELFAY